MAALAVLAGLGVGGAVAVSRNPPDSTGYPDQRRPGTVLLVPGYGGNQASLAPLATRIRAAGRSASVVALPGDGTGDLAAQADALDSAVAGALRGGVPSVDLVGYSAGGVVVRLWVARHDGQHRARRVVTLGSPLHGTTLAAAGSALVPAACPVACQQLVPGSALLRDLDAHPLPPQLPWLSLWTRDDQTVTPPDSARLAGAVDVELQSICSDAHVEHGALPSDPLVTGLVLRAIDVTPLTAPTPAGCPALRAQGGG